MKKILFLCSQNKRRSLTAEKIFSAELHCQVKSAGTEKNTRIKVTAGMIGWADVIYVMENKHHDRLRQHFADEIKTKPIINLRIKDNYAFMEEDLIELLRDLVDL